ncbi:MAG: zinc carboxypeptidase, partial [Candidatus Delongbacteria bacterium]|nr:zinc carboxypeptidase [Candidatus Delongbacteria bacterium]
MKKYSYIYSAILFFISLYFTTNIYSAEKILIRFDNPDKQTIEKFIHGNYDIASYHPDKYLDLVIEISHYSEMLKVHPKIKILKTEKQIKADLHKEKDIPGYRSYAQTLAELQQIEIDNPDICKLYNIGKSQGKTYSEDGNSNYNTYNHNIWALKLSDNVQIEEDEPSFYFLGAHHAREPISTEVCMEILSNMLSSYGSDADTQKRINNSQIWFVPIVNPDGQKAVLTELNVWWRKNIRDNDNSGSFEYLTGELPISKDGVDPNRNYDFWWGPNGTSEEPSSSVYKGPYPSSEPEIQAVKNLINSHHFIAGITYHSYGEIVLHPFGYEYNAIPPDVNSMSVLAENLASSIPSVYGGYYTPFQSVYLYPTMGTTNDYAYGEHGIFSFTIELANEFIPPYESALNICNNNLSAANILLDRVYTSTLTGVISDQVSKSPIVAKIFVEGIDDSGAFKEPYKSDEIFGRYYRFL